jgi:hypothetical protein
LTPEEKRKGKRKERKGKGRFDACPGAEQRNRKDIHLLSLADPFEVMALQRRKGLLKL